MQEWVNALWAEKDDLIERLLPPGLEPAGAG
jgi:hypothetical protein